VWHADEAYDLTTIFYNLMVCVSLLDLQTKWRPAACSLACLDHAMRHVSYCAAIRCVRIRLESHRQPATPRVPVQFYLSANAIRPLRLVSALRILQSMAALKICDIAAEAVRSVSRCRSTMIDVHDLALAS